MMRIDVGEWQIRSFRTQDTETLARYANNRNVSRNLRDAFPYPYTGLENLAAGGMPAGLRAGQARPRGLRAS